MDDLISRQDAITISILPKEHRKYQTTNLDDAYELGWHDCQECINYLPPARSEQKTGRWKEHIFDGVMGHRPHALMCTQCNTISLYAYNFCPYCGANMEEEG